MKTLFCVVSGVLLFAATADMAGAMLSERTYQRLEQIHELIRESRLDEAEAALGELEARARNNPHEHALVLEARAFVDENRGDVDIAMARLAEALAWDGLPPDLRLHLEYSRARLLLSANRPRQALALLDDWFAQVAEPSPQAWMLRAAVYAQLQRDGEAIEAARIAVRRSARPQAGWYGFLAGLLLAQAQYAEAQSLLERMVQHWPLEPRYWEQLAAVRLYLDNNRGALAALRLAHAQNVLEREASIVRLTRLAIAEGLPEPAGRLLRQAINEQLVEASREHLELLANAWLHAREWQQAMTALEQAAVLASDGELYLRIARVALERQDTAAAAAAVMRALEAGVDEPARAWLLAGIIRVEQENYRQATAAFERVRDDEELAAQADQWLRYIEAVAGNTPG